MSYIVPNIKFQNPDSGNYAKGLLMPVISHSVKRGKTKLNKDALIKIPSAGQAALHLFSDAENDNWKKQ